MWVWLSSFAVFVALFGFEAVRMSEGQDPVIKSTSSTTTQSTTSSSTSQTSQSQQQAQQSQQSQDYTPAVTPSTGSS